jgi:hypothetical protein
MSMNFSEFTRRLGTEPSSRDPEIQRARRSSPEFEQAARAADAFERKLVMALDVSLPWGLLDDIKAIADHQPPKTATAERSLRWKPLALAASVLMAVGAAGITWKMDHGRDVVGDYLVAHYSLDGANLVARAEGQTADNVPTILTAMGFEATPELTNMVGFIKFCPTPDGKGVHMVLNTEQGPVTVILMPKTSVTDHESLSVNGLHAYLVALSRGSAAIIGASNDQVAKLGPMVHDSIIFLAAKA